jgi:hypothetical protein
MTLRSGIMHNGVVSATTEGTTQGSPLSPLLSNFVLDELDKRLEQRGFSFCRFADDLNAYVGSKKAADRLMENLTGFIEGKLKLKVNREKSKVAKSQFIKFLGMTIVAGTIAISQVSLGRAMTKVKELSPRGTTMSRMRLQPKQPTAIARDGHSRTRRGWKWPFQANGLRKEAFSRCRNRGLIGGLIGTNGSG